MNLANRGDVPHSLPPFFVRSELNPHRDDYRTWQVCAAHRRGEESFAIVAGLPNQFDALHVMVDILEVWQGIKPVDRVYFIGTELRRGALIKVGYSRDPEARLRALQTGHGETLRIFATTPGGKDLEAKYHRRWHSRRRSGEWFTVGDCIIDEIKRLNASLRIPTGMVE
jgi:hypothetical protein